MFSQNTKLPMEELKILFKKEFFPKRNLIRSFPRSFEHAIDIFHEAKNIEMQYGIRCIPYFHEEYPQELTQYLPEEKQPAILYYRGQKITDEKSNIAIVGTRKPSYFGREQAKNFSSFFSSLNFSIISGLAKGIDSICHEESLLNHTIAILGGELVQAYPKENQKLSEKIIENSGTLLSQFPLYQTTLPQNFPQRNELIAALSAGTIVVEGNEKSGAAITGKLSLEMGKTVVVLSQDFRTPFGRGAIQLHNAGAIFVCSEEDALQAIFARFGGIHKEQLRKTFTLDEFHQKSKHSFSESIALLEEAILSGQVRRIAKNRYQWNCEQTLL